MDRHAIYTSSPQLHMTNTASPAPTRFAQVHDMTIGEQVKSANPRHYRGYPSKMCFARTKISGFLNDSVLTCNPPSRPAARLQGSLLSCSPARSLSSGGARSTSGPGSMPASRPSSGRGIWPCCWWHRFSTSDSRPRWLCGCCGPALPTTLVQ